MLALVSLSLNDHPAGVVLDVPLLESVLKFSQTGAFSAAMTIVGPGVGAGVGVAVGVGVGVGVGPPDVTLKVPTLVFQACASVEEKYSLVIQNVALSDGSMLSAL